MGANEQVAGHLAHGAEHSRIANAARLDELAHHPLAGEGVSATFPVSSSSTDTAEAATQIGVTVPGRGSP